MYAIYLKHVSPKGIEHESVLLTDGAWTAEHNCYDQTYGYTAMIPKLFPRKRNAQHYAKKTGRTSKRYAIHKYTGPSDPR